MRALWLGTSLAVLLSASLATAKELRLHSPDGLFCAVYHYSNAEVSLVESISFSDSEGHTLFSDNYGMRDYRPEKGRWTRSSRFFVYTLSSRGGHSPWHRPFVVADMQTRRSTAEGDIGHGDCISDFQLSGRDTIAYKILDRSKDNWDAGIPSIPVRFSLSAKFPPK
jgi:hypothetical protein